MVQYLQTLKERVEAKEISAGTMKNRYQVIKLFCDMADITISWNKITKGIPKVRRFADDRAPTIEEVSKIKYWIGYTKAIDCSFYCR
jgi:hypothetical protein